jgi:DnaJ-class molecular chaperone
MGAPRRRRVPLLRESGYEAGCEVMMADDPYKILGVAKTATADEIRKAYRKAAKLHHPDLNPGNQAAEEKFKTLSAANELLSDPEKRARFDAGEIDGTGAERAPPRGYRQYADTGAGERYGYGAGAGPGFGAGESFEDLFSTIFADGTRRQRGAGPVRGHDEHYMLNAEFLDAVNGATSRLTLPDGQTLDVKIPPGTAAGQVLRLRGRGEAGLNGGPAGDALIEIRVKPHRFFVRDGQNIRLDLPITLREAVLGGKITVPTPAGPVAMTVKPNTESGAELRLRGRGVPGAPAGDLFVTLRVMVGPPDPALEAFLRAAAPAQPFDPRAGMEEGS